MPSPHEGEQQSEFVSRCMSDEKAKKSFPDQKQRVAFCHSQWKSKSSMLNRADDAYQQMIASPKATSGLLAGMPGTPLPSGGSGMEKDAGGVDSPIVSEPKPQPATWPATPSRGLGAELTLVADEKAGYPPNCNAGYVEKDGKCVPLKKEEASFRYEHPKTGEVYTYRRKGVYKKGGVFLIYKGKAKEE